MFNRDYTYEPLTVRHGARVKLGLAAFGTCLFFIIILSLLSFKSKVYFVDDNEENAVENRVEAAKESTIDAGMPKQCWKNSRRKNKPGLNPGFPIQYIHVPKAGGTTIQESILPWANKRGYHVYLHNGDHDGVWKCPGIIDRGVLMGHRGFGFCDRMQKRYGQNALFLVALREPVSRFRSLFDYFMDNDYPQFAEYHAMWKGKDLSQLIMDAYATLKLKLPIKDPRMRGPIRFMELARQQTNFMCGWDCVSLKSNLTMSEKLDRALDNLMRTDVVVVMEKLDDLIDQLRYHTYLVPTEIKRFPMENTAKGKKSILTKEAADIVAEWSKRDIVLYEMAKKRHESLTNHARKCLEGGKLSPKSDHVVGDDDEDDEDEDADEDKVEDGQD